MQIATYSLLLEYKGSDTELKPFALLSHYDVVPANASNWSVPPFGGIVKDGCALLLRKLLLNIDQTTYSVRPPTVLPPSFPRCGVLYGFRALNVLFGLLCLGCCMGTQPDVGACGMGGLQLCVGPRSHRLEGQRSGPPACSQPVGCQWIQAPALVLCRTWS